MREETKPSVIGIRSTGRERLAPGQPMTPEQLAQGQDRMEAYMRRLEQETNVAQAGNINGMMKMKVEACSYADGFMRLAFPVQLWQANRAGMLHGGIFCTAMDITMGAAARFYAGESYAPTLELDIRYLRPVRLGDELVVTAYVQAAGRTITHLRAEAASRRTGKLTATATAIFMAQDNRKGNHMKEYQPIKEGKVREIYDAGDSLIMVATDRISAFDHILKNKIDKKGTVLTQMSKFWFDLTEDIVPNHMLSVDPADMPAFFQTERFAGNSMKCRKLTMLPIECIVRGYITGSGWKSYQENGTVCGIQLPAGLKESEKLPEPIYTPSTKADLGDHDENISYEESIDVLEKAFPGKGEDYAAKTRDYTLAIYKKCADYALARDIIIADTKLEFGLDEDGNIVLGDEILTPDSSRFWPRKGYAIGQAQPSYDKQFVRDWLKAHPDSDYLLPDDVIKKTIDKYLEAYRLLTGKDL